MVQADVPIFGGSSGGPLVDGSGNLAGLAVAGYANTTLNFFIPVADALGKLEVSLGPRP
jgi:S1-C subfamily serine protease